MGSVKRGWKILTSVVAAILAGILITSFLVLNWLGLGISESKLLPAVPALFGCNQPQKYFVAFTSSAEARALGGLIGQYAVVEIDCTSISVKEIGINAQLQNTDVFLQAQAKYPDIFLGKNVEWVNSNLFPDGQLVGSMWLTAYKEQTGQQLDGAIALDVPFLVDLSILSGFSFKDKSGNSLTSKKQILNYLLNGIYFDYPIDNIKRKSIQLELSRQMVSSLSNNTASKLKILKLFSQTLKENRIFIYRPDLSDNESIKNYPMFYILNPETKFIHIGANNLSGSKFDFYNDFKYTLGKCENNAYVLDVQIKNSAVASTQFPEYVNNRLEKSPVEGVGSKTQILVILPRQTTPPTWQVPSDWSGGALTLSGGNVAAYMVGTVQAGQSYSTSIRFSSPDSLKILSWGQRLETATRSASCLDSGE